MPCKHAPQQGSRDTTLAATIRLCARRRMRVRACACARRAKATPSGATSLHLMPPFLSSNPSCVLYARPSYTNTLVPKMPKTRSGKRSRPTDEEKESALAEAVSQLEGLDSQTVMLLCERLGVENSHELTDVGCVEAIKDVDRWHHQVKRMLDTKKFADQLEAWKEMKERGIQPVTLLRMQTLWLWDFDMDTQTDHLRVLCAYVGVEMDGTHLELIERLEVVPNINRYKPVLETPLWEARISNSDAFLASNPPRTSLQRLWLQKLSTDELKLMCASLGISIDGDHGALFARLDAMADLDRYKAYLTSDWWWREVNSDKLQERFAKYKPSSERTQQLAYSHIPTTEPRRQEWLGCTPWYSVSGTGDAASTAAAEAPTAADSPPLGEDDAAVPPEVAETIANNA